MLRECIEKSYDKHMSPNAQNEILQILALKILHVIASDIGKYGCYSDLADESTDVSKNELLVICIHRSEKEMTVCEEYIDLMPVTQTNVDKIVICIKVVLLCINLRIQAAHG